MKRRYALLMLTTIALVATAVFVPAATAAGLNTGAGPWQWLFPVAQGTTINDISFINDNTGWAVGQGGVIMKTTDGGATWSSQNSGTTYNLLGVDFVNSSTGWIAGNLGDFTSFVLKTTDGGATWTQQTLPTGYATAVLESVDFVNSSLGVLVGNGKIYYTSNGGATWTQVTSGTSPGQVNPSHYLKRVQMVDASTGYAVGPSGVIYKTINGGSAWTQQTTGVTSSLNGVYFKNANEGIVVGSGGGAGRVLRTTNGGTNWTANDTGSAPISTPLMDVAASTNDETFIAAGNDGNIYYYQKSLIWNDTADQWATGLNGGARASGADGIINSIEWTSSSTAYAGGEAGLVTKSDGTIGNSWSLKAGGNAYNLVAIDFVDADNGWAAGDDGRVYGTTDGGDSWNADNTGLPSSFHVYDIDFVSNSYGVAVGCDGGGCPSGGASAAYYYNGSNWTAMGGIAGTTLNDVKMTSTTEGWAVGADGIAFRTINGTSWSSDAAGLLANHELNGVDSITAGTKAWAVGNNSSTGNAIYATWSGGTWTVSSDFPSTSFFIDVDMLDANTGYFVGSGGALYKTTNGGGVWTQQSSGTSKLLAGISCLNTSYCFAVGEDGRLIHTTDGTNWGAENMGTNVSFFEVSTVGERQAFVAGGNGSIMKSLRSYYYTWYDNIGGNNWVLMANPVGNPVGDLTFTQYIAGIERSLDSGGVVAPGDSLTPKYSGVIGGPVNTSSMTSDKAIVSQRVLWPKGGSSLEEVLGFDVDRLSNHYVWTWYDQVSAGYTNWVLVANPNPFTVYYQIKVAGTVRNQGTIAAGKNVTPTLAGVKGGPVEVLAWNDNYNGSNKADVFASQRVLSNGGSAFNEQVGTPVEELASRYLWTWYDNTSPGARNWILIANRPGSGYNLFYEIWIDGVYVCSEAVCEGSGGGGSNWAATPGGLTAGSNVTPMFSRQGGPVEVKTFSDAGHTIPANSISSQRIVWGPSFAETPGYPYDDLSPSYHWSWYDNLAAGMKNWVLVYNPDAAPIDYDILIAGSSRQNGTLGSGDSVTPRFPGVQAGPVEVRCVVEGGNWSNPGDRRDCMASQRVLYNNYFNELLGTVLD